MRLPARVHNLYTQPIYMQARQNVLIASKSVHLLTLAALSLQLTGSVLGVLETVPFAMFSRVTHDRQMNEPLHVTIRVWV